METLALLGTALGLSLASGLSLYGSAFLVGLAIHLGWVQLAPGWQSLAVLADPLVLGISAVLFAMEFFADKIPGSTGVGRGAHLHSPRRGALLASRAFGDLHPAAEVAVLLLLGGVSLAAHGAKASTRLVANASPEPVSNILLSLTENALVVGTVWLALSHPLLTLVLGLVALALALTLIVWLGRRAFAALRRWRARRLAPSAMPAVRADEPVSVARRGGE